MSDTPSAHVSKTAFYTGWVLSILPALMLTMSATFKFTQPPDVVKGFEHLGWPLGLAVALGVVELACVVIYLFPKTAVLGAILLTGYLGGAVAAHVRLEEQFAMPVILGVMLWGGLYLRDIRLRALLPFRS
jgi:hypothetical protein